MSSTETEKAIQRGPLDIVLFHFGGPTNEAEVEPFLFRLFMDPFIIRASLGPLRKWLAKRISKKRAPETDHQYRQIGYSPINRYTEAQAQHLRRLLAAEISDVKIHVVNRYTAPFAEQVIPNIRWDKARVVGLTLYPHVSHSTVVSSYRDFDVMAKSVMGRLPVMQKIYSWWFVEAYMQLSWRQLRDTLANAIKSPANISVLFSAHGLPEKYVDRGDPYVNDVACHFASLKELGVAWLNQQGGQELVKRVNWGLSFQSRVGPVEWVRPYTEDAIASIGKAYQGSLVLVPISFVSDHIETLYEMDVTYRDLALAAGCKDYLRVKPANDGEELARALVEVLRVHRAL